MRRRQSPESGVALLISLFALLLICVVGVALIMATGTDSALTGNYRSAGSVYYASMAGLAEARQRLLPQAPDNVAVALGLPTGTLPGAGSVWYIINPLPGETVAPWDVGTPTTYPDLEYITEFGVNPPTAPNLASTTSDSATAGPGGPIYTTYKWVRINLVTVGAAQTFGVSVNNGAGAATTPLTYVNNHMSVDQPGPPVLEITSLAAMPNGSQRMLQYLVAPTSLGLTFPAALMLDGNNVLFQGPPTETFSINGQDTKTFPGCAAGTAVQVGIGYTNNGDSSGANIFAGIPPPTPGPPPYNYNGNYIGFGGGTPNILGNPPINFPTSLLTPSGMDAIATLVTQNADAVITGPATPASFPGLMSAANPMTVVVNGNLDTTGWNHTGYGILLVTGTLTYDPATSWMGIVLVIGQGNAVSTAGGSGEIDGAVLVAQTRAADGTLLPDPTLGPASWSQTGGGLGIYYSSCWVNAVQKAVTYKILSFREIPLN